jgi:hypothetical protein
MKQSIACRVRTTSALAPPLKDGIIHLGGSEQVSPKVSTGKSASDSITAVLACRPLTHLQDDLDDTEAVIEQTSRRATASSTTVSLGGDAGQAASGGQQDEGGLPEVPAPTEKVRGSQSGAGGIHRGNTACCVCICCRADDRHAPQPCQLLHTHLVLSHVSLMRASARVALVHWCRWSSSRPAVSMWRLRSWTWSRQVCRAWRS